MPAISSRSRGRRRAMNDINMVPFIDVMLVLLIIFMDTAPLITTGLVDLPSVGQSQQRPQTVVEVVVASDGRLRLRSGGEEAAAVTLAQLVGRVQQAQGGKPDTPVVISADRSVRYEQVVKVMDTLQRAGIRRVGLSVKQGA